MLSGGSLGMRCRSERVQTERYANAFRLVFLSPTVSFPSDFVCRTLGVTGQLQLKLATDDKQFLQLE